MPSVEFLGYSESEQSVLLDTLREDLSSLAFYQEIVYVTYNSQIEDYQGKPQAYLRVCTRNEEKAKVLLKRLQHYADVEFIKSADILFKIPESTAV